jgi:hypothetical protein
LKRKPIGRKASLITPNMWKNIIVQALWQIIVLGLILFKGEVIFNVPSSRGHAEEFKYFCF